MTHPIVAEVEEIRRNLDSSFRTWRTFDFRIDRSLERIVQLATAFGGVVEPSGPLTAEEADPITPEVYAEHFPERDDTGKPLTAEEATPDPLSPVLLPDPEANQDVCPKSRRVDGPYHSTRWDGDDSRTVCVFCGQVRDALSGEVIPGLADLLDTDEEIEADAARTARLKPGAFMRTPVVPLLPEPLLNEEAGRG